MVRYPDKGESFVDGEERFMVPVMYALAEGGGESLIG